MDEMATVTRRANPSLEEQLVKQTYEFDFHQAIRLLEKLRPHATPLGEGSNPLNEAVSIESRVTQSPSGADLQGLSGVGQDERPVLTVNFLGVGGIQGPLPSPYTELLVERLRQKDTGFKDFLDMFNHRLAGFWHRMRKKVVLGIAQVQPEATPAGKSFLDLAGIQSPFLRNRLAIHDQALLSHTAALWKRPRSLIGLQRLLRSIFSLPIIVNQFQGGWQVARERDWTKIGSSSGFPGLLTGQHSRAGQTIPVQDSDFQGEEDGESEVAVPLAVLLKNCGQHQVLGQSSVLGRRSWCQNAGICLHLPLLSYEQYLGFQKESTDFKALRDVTFFYIDQGQKVHMSFSVQRQHIRPTVLNTKFALGMNTWMTRGEGKGFTRDPEMRREIFRI
jgi:type VI secretion system protein ImpH